MEQSHITAYFSRAKASAAPLAVPDSPPRTATAADTEPSGESAGEESAWPVAFSAHSKSTISMLEFLVKRDGPRPQPQPARPLKRLKPALGVPSRSQSKITQFALAPERPVVEQDPRLSRYLLHRIMTFLLLRENARLAACCRAFRAAARYLWAAPDYLESFSTDWMSPAELEYLRRKLKTVHLELLDRLLLGRVAKGFLERNSILISAHAEPGARTRHVREFTARPQARLNRAVNLLDRDLEALYQMSRHTLYLLELRKCVYLTPRGFALLPQFRKLRTLRLASIDLPEGVFLEVVQQCRFLSELAVIQCPKLTALSLVRLLSECTWLMQLDVSLSASLFDGFEAFGLFGRPKLLEALSLGGTGVGAAGLAELAAAAPGLKRLAFSRAADSPELRARCAGRVELHPQP